MDPAVGRGRGRWGGCEKHEVYAATFGSHLFHDLFLQGWGGGEKGRMAPRPLPGSATAQIELSIRKLGKLVKFKHFSSSEKAREKSDIRVFLILVLQ